MAGALTAAIAAAFSGSAVVTDPQFEYTTLLLPGNGTDLKNNNEFLDSSSNAFTVTRNPLTGPNAPTQGTFSPFSQTGWSGAFNTSTTYLTVTDTSNLRFGSSNFTIEAFVYRAASGATQTIASKGASTPTGWVFQISSADKLVFTDTSTSITGATSLTANTWHYVAVVRAGTGSNQTTLYVNAVSDATGTSATTFSQTDNMKIGADRSNTNFANGYISNLRLSNTNRTISSTPTSALAADSNTIFLGLYNNRFQYTDSTAAFTSMTVTGTPSVQAFSPFNPSASWSAATYGGSGYFDGSGDYLTTQNTGQFAPAGNFTIGLWFYPTSLAAAFSAPLGNFTGNNSTDWLIEITSAGVLNFYTNGSTVRIASSSGAVKANQWQYIALCRSSSTITGYLNGDSVGTYSQSGTFGSATKSIGIGARPDSQEPVTGYISSVILIDGSVNTSVPAAPSTNVSGTSLLLNFTNAGIYDATSKNDLETVGDAQVSTAITAKWGSGCMKFNGTTDYLRFNTSNFFSIYQGSNTVEMWVYPTSISSGGSNSARFGTLFTQQALGSSIQFGLGFNSSGQLVYTYWNGSATVQITSTETISINNWSHVGFTYTSSGIALFVNGVYKSATALTGTPGTSTSEGLFIGLEGRNTGSYLYYQGYIQDFRFTKGVARYTANFTAPTAAFPTL